MARRRGREDPSLTDQYTAVTISSGHANGLLDDDAIVEAAVPADY
jgi:hypothetical protein